jgi:hypothetical protein
LGELARQQSAENLAGRMERIEIGAFSLAELRADAADRLWLAPGGFPRACLADDRGRGFATMPSTALTGLATPQGTKKVQCCNALIVRCPASKL